MSKLGKNGESGKETSGAEEVRQVKDELDAQKKVKIIIPSTEVDREDVKVGIMGYVYQIKRDTPVAVPMSVVKALQDAVMTTYKQVPRKDKDSEGYDMIPFETMRYPFRVVFEE